MMYTSKMNRSGNDDTWFNVASVMGVPRRDSVYSPTVTPGAQPTETFPVVVMCPVVSPFVLLPLICLLAFVLESCMRALPPACPARALHTRPGGEMGEGAGEQGKRGTATDIIADDLINVATALNVTIVKPRINIGTASIVATAIIGTTVTAGPEAHSQHIILGDGDTLTMKTIGGRRIIPSCLHLRVAPIAKIRGAMNPPRTVSSGLPNHASPPSAAHVATSVRPRPSVPNDVTTRGEGGARRQVRMGSASERSGLLPISDVVAVPVEIIVVVLDGAGHADLIDDVASPFHLKGWSEDVDRAAVPSADEDHADAVAQPREAANGTARQLSSASAVGRAASTNSK